MANATNSTATSTNQYTDEIQRALKKHKNIRLSKYRMPDGTVQKYFIIGPKNFEKKITDSFKVIQMSYYGRKLLDGTHRALSRGKINLTFVASELSQPGSIWHQYVKSGDIPTGIYIFLNFNLLSRITVGTNQINSLSRNPAYKKFRPTPLAKPPVSTWLNPNTKLRQVVPSPNPTGYLTTEMTVAHELFHIFSAFKIKTDKLFPVKSHYAAQTLRPELKKEEAHAVRYTNLIRIDLDMGYIRASYTKPGILVDKVTFARNRWSSPDSRNWKF